MMNTDEGSLKWIMSKKKSCRITSADGSMFVGNQANEIMNLHNYHLLTHFVPVSVRLLVYNQGQHRHAPPSCSSGVPGLTDPAGEEEGGSGRDPGGFGSSTQCEAHGLVASTVPLRTLRIGLPPPPFGCRCSRQPLCEPLLLIASVHTKTEKS